MTCKANESNTQSVKVISLQKPKITKKLKHGVDSILLIITLHLSFASLGNRVMAHHWMFYSHKYLNLDYVIEEKQTRMFI